MGIDQQQKKNPVSAPHLGNQSYPGGKGGVGVYQQIINCMPPHDTYVEAFLGGGAVLRHKEPARRNIGIELDETVVTNWKASAMPGLELINGDAVEILEAWPWKRDEPTRTLVYCDPPYLQATRSSKRKIYRCEFSSVEGHAKLLDVLRTLPCMVILSGYSSQLYVSMIGHWRHLDFVARNRAGKPTLETIWMNFPSPRTLHDYRYFGEDFRERERVKRKRERLKARLQKMPPLEREAVLSVLEEINDFRQL